MYYSMNNTMAEACNERSFNTILVPKIDLRFRSPIIQKRFHPNGGIYIVSRVYWP